MIKQLKPDALSRARFMVNAHFIKLLQIQVTVSGIDHHEDRRGLRGAVQCGVVGLDHRDDAVALDDHWHRVSRGGLRTLVAVRADEHLEVLPAFDLFAT